MIITCHGCEAQYAIPDDKVRHRNVRVRCRECSTVIRVERLDGRASSAPPPAASVRAAAFPSPFDDMPASVPPPASSGGVVTTASEQSDRITSPVQVRAQVARREDDARSKRDLFSKEEVAVREAVPKPREVIPPPAPLGLSTGARNETSVLFSLATLTVGKSSAPPPPPVGEMRPKEDSGLIDLNQLMASRVETSFRFVPPPLPSDPPLGAYTSEVGGRSPSISDAALAAFGGGRRRSRRVVAIGAVAALAAIVGVVAFAWPSGKSEPQADVGSGPVMSTTAAIAAAAAAQPPPAPVTLASTAAPINAKPIVAGAGAGGNAAGASDAYAGPPNHRHRHGHHGGGGAAHAGHAKAAGAASAPAKPPAASDPCGCHGNLMCAMKCSS